MEIDPDLDWLIDVALDDEMPRARSGDFVTFSVEKKPAPPALSPSGNGGDRNGGGGAADR